jgi:hypothetical protein
MSDLKIESGMNSIMLCGQSRETVSLIGKPLAGLALSAIWERQSLKRIDVTLG